MLGSPVDLMSILLPKHLARVLQCKPFLISISQHHGPKRVKVTWQMVPFCSKNFIYSLIVRDLGPWNNRLSKADHRQQPLHLESVVHFPKHVTSIGPSGQPYEGQWLGVTVKLGKGLCSTQLRSNFIFISHCPIRPVLKSWLSSDLWKESRAHPMTFLVTLGWLKVSRNQGPLEKCVIPGPGHRKYK